VKRYDWEDWAIASLTVVAAASGIGMVAGAAVLLWRLAFSI